MIDLAITHLTHPWGPLWTLETLGDHWRHAWKWPISPNYRNSSRCFWQLFDFLNRTTVTYIKERTSRRPLIRAWQSLETSDLIRYNDSEENIWTNWHTWPWCSESNRWNHHLYQILQNATLQWISGKCSGDMECMKMYQESIWGAVVRGDVCVDSGEIRDIGH